MLLADEASILDAKTGGDGVLIRDWPRPRDPSSKIDFLRCSTAATAVTARGCRSSKRAGETLTAAPFLATDRPAYRPGQGEAPPSAGWSAR